MWSKHNTASKEVREPKGEKRTFRLMKKTQFDGKIVQQSILLYFALIIPLSVVHESGHYLACVSAGHQGTVGLSFRGMWTGCSPDLETFAFNVLGPVFGTIGAAGVFALGFYTKRVFVIVGAAFLVDQIMKVILEGFVTVIYVSGTLDVLITVVQIAGLFGAIVWLGRKRT